MPADVVKRAHVSIVRAHDDRGLAKEFEGMEIAGRRDIVDVAHELPGGAENRALLELEEVRIVVDPRRQAQPLLVGIGRRDVLN